MATLQKRRFVTPGFGNRTESQLTQNKAHNSQLHNTKPLFLYIIVVTYGRDLVDMGGPQRPGGGASGGVRPGISESCKSLPKRAGNEFTRDARKN